MKIIYLLTSFSKYCAKHQNASISLSNTIRIGDRISLIPWIYPTQIIVKSPSILIVH